VSNAAEGAAPPLRVDGPSLALTPPRARLATHPAASDRPGASVHGWRSAAAWCGLRLPVRFLRGHYGRVALTILALASGVASVCANEVLGPSVVRAFQDVVATTVGRADLQVGMQGAARFRKDDVINAVARVPGVARVVPVLSATAFTTDGTNELLAVHAFDLLNMGAPEVYGVHFSAHTPAPTSRVVLPGGVILTESFARRHQLGVGGRIDLDTPRGRQTFTVGGVLDGGGLGRLYDGNLLVMDLYAAQLAFARGGEISRLDIVLKPDQSASAVAQAIAAVVPAGMRAETPGHQKGVLENTLRSIRLLLRGFGLSGLVLAFLIAFNSLSTLFEGRVWQLGLLRAVGVRHSAVWRELLTEGFLVGVAGVLLGIPLGIAYARVLLPLLTTLSALDLNTVTPSWELTVPHAALALAAGLGLGAAVLAAALPAWRAAHVDIVETIRGRGREQAGVQSGRRWLARAAVGGLTGIAIVLQLHVRSGLLGLAAGLLLAVAAALAARPLVNVLGRLVTHRAGHLAGPWPRFAATHLTRHPRRAALLIATIGVGIGSVLWLWMLAGSFEHAVIELATATIQTDLVVSSSHVGSGFLEAPAPGDLVAALRRLPDVAAVAGVRTIEWPYHDGPIVISAHDGAYISTGRFGRWPVVGTVAPAAWEAVASGAAVLASANFMQNLHAQVGDTVRLDTPDGVLALRIAGVITELTSPRGTLIMSREAYVRHWHDEQITRAYVQTVAGADVDAVRAVIAAALGRPYGVHVLRGADLVEYFASQVRRAFAAMDVHAAVMLVVVLIGLAETLMASVAARTRELGTIRVVGAQRRHLQRIMVIEALLLSGLGLVLAVATGLAQGALWVDATFPALFGFIFPLHVPYARTAVLVVLTVAVCLVAALLPARRAARLIPAVAVRDE